MSRHQLEICVADAASLDAAIAGGADRIELCSALELGGLTPAPGLMHKATGTDIPVYAMIRPRSGDFVFDAADLAVMQADIAAVADHGLTGVVLGASLPDGRLDIDMLTTLAATARRHRLGTTLHRAFDLVPDIGEAVDAAIALGFERILTSGRSARAADGIDDLVAAHRRAGGRCAIMAGAGIDPGAVRAIAAAVPLTQWHASCGIDLAQASGAIGLGFSAPSRRRTSADKVRALRDAIDALP